MEDNMSDIEIAFDHAIEKYSNMVYRIAVNQLKNKSDADDVFQEVFIKWMEHRTEFENEVHEKAWLIRVTLNQCKSLLSSSWFKKTTGLEERKEGEYQVFLEEENTELKEAMNRLPIKYRSVIHLFYYEELSVMEISQILHSKESTIRTQLTRARRVLKKLLKGAYEDV